MLQTKLQSEDHNLITEDKHKPLLWLHSYLQWREEFGLGATQKDSGPHFDVGLKHVIVAHTSKECIIFFMLLNIQMTPLHCHVASLKCNILTVTRITMLQLHSSNCTKKLEFVFGKAQKRIRVTWEEGGNVFPQSYE